MLANLRTNYGGKNHFGSISDQKWDDSRKQCRFPIHVCLVSKPCGPKTVANDASCDHAKKADQFVAGEFVDENACDNCHGNKADQISASRTEKFLRPAAEAGEDRNPDKANEQIDQIAHGSFLRAKHIERNINR